MSEHVRENPTGTCGERRRVERRCLRCEPGCPTRPARAKLVLRRADVAAGDSRPEPGAEPRPDLRELAHELLQQAGGEQVPPSPPRVAQRVLVLPVADEDGVVVDGLPVEREREQEVEVVAEAERPVAEPDVPRR